jgi:secondary thiamine-phosphate synthase enzyme
MASPLFLAERLAPQIKAASDLVHLRTEQALQFVDLTDLVAERVRRSGVDHGLVCVQTLHTTAAIVVNENEPLLIEDLKRRLERLAPRGDDYAHDDIPRRADVEAGERQNGHAHCKALFLSPSVTLTVAAGRLLLGRWQRVFLLELDAGRTRGISILVLGTTREDETRWS